ncbi:hypothetical protein SAICODRAFT_59404 [Saitoella complicata NRRL Y-17804]|uniref:uncharacterized protein n=1 Tax=Saitoella complicata (strain BCRC 22490 / CBS 7301 / JCM 7358 / NBRC 10748 / NRRL Y-17804) TaxID=698492 RepID=UPI000867B2B7|nr:uncharacterized protein SAICODRAFT_59404 [Saitoella complicata NRRL Y-17804]ODQ51775.1 hypothetical protein SAICODRAFT_59404 [Saitoella complicata NRRL Y-17804]
MPKFRYSGIQLDVLHLYRACFRAVRSKPVDAQPHFKHFIRSEFQKNMGLSKKDFSTVEFLVRKGNRQLEMYRNPGIKDIR